MSNNLKILVYGAIGFIGYKALASQKDDSIQEPENKISEEAPKQTYPTPVQSTPVQQSTDSFPLKQGSRGSNVMALQKLLIEYARLKNLPIAKSDPMKLDKDGNPDGIFGPQTGRWAKEILKTLVVDPTAYYSLEFTVGSLKRMTPAKPATYKIGDLVYAKGGRTVTRYRAGIEIRDGNVSLIPTFEQFVAWLKKGNVSKALDKVDFSHGEIIGRIAHIRGDQYRIVVTRETDHHVWWINPLKTHKDYFIFTPDQIFK